MKMIAYVCVIVPVVMYLFVWAMTGEVYQVPMDRLQALPFLRLLLIGFIGNVIFHSYYYFKGLNN